MQNVPHVACQHACKSNEDGDEDYADQPHRLPHHHASIASLALSVCKPCARLGTGGPGVAGEDANLLPDSPKCWNGALWAPQKQVIPR